jgi:hypothetical protein
MIRSGFPDQEYLLLEYRTNATGGFEANFYGAGMVIYHVDDTVDLNRKIGYPGQTGWPSNGNLYMVSVLQAGKCMCVWDSKLLLSTDTRPTLPQTVYTTLRRK